MIKKTYYYISNYIPSIFELSRSSVAKNAAALYAIQFAELFLPLITIPYVVRALSPAGYGLIGFVTGLISYFTIFVDYGFSMSSTREISINQKNQAKINQIFSKTIISKMIIFIIGLTILIILGQNVNKIKPVFNLVMVAYIGIIGNIIFPQWLYQGMEKMSFLAIANLLTKLAMTISIFMLIHNKTDILLYLAILSGGQIFNGIIAFIKSIKLFDIKFSLPSFRLIKQALSEGWMLFLSNASISLYTAGNPFILGFFVSPAIVGYYTAAERIVKASLGAISPITQAIYPKFSKLSHESKESFFRQAKYVLKIMTLLGGFISLFLFIGSPLIIKILLGTQYSNSIILIRLLSVIPLAVAISNVLGVQIMLPLGKDKAFTKILFIAGLINFILVLALAPKIGAKASAIAFSVCEIYIAVAMIFYLYQFRKKFIMEDKNA